MKSCSGTELEWRPIEVFRYDTRQVYIGEADNDGGNGTFNIVPENAKVQNSRQYGCQVSRVGVSAKVSFKIIGK